MAPLKSNRLSYSQNFNEESLHKYPFILDIRLFMRICLFLLSAQLSAGLFFGGEAIVLRPLIYRPYSAIISPNLPGDWPQNGNYVGRINPPYNLGYRIEGGIDRFPYRFQIGWMSWIHTGCFQVSAQSDQRLWLIFTHHSRAGTRDYLSPATLRRLDHLKYQVFDARFVCNLRALEGFLGFRYSRFRYNSAIDINGISQIGNPAFVVDRWESDLHGGGVRFGVQSSCPLFWSLVLTGEASGACLLGTLKGSYLDQQFVPNVDNNLVSNRIPSTSLVLLNAEGVVGIARRFQAAKHLFIQAHASYQISYYSKGNVWMIFTDREGTGVNEIHREAFAIDGWRFGITGGF